MEKTRVIFRKDSFGVFALFPDNKVSKNKCVGYSVREKHFHTIYNYEMNESKPCTEEEYAPLKKELEELGYTDIEIVDKI